MFICAVIKVFIIQPIMALPYQLGIVDMIHWVEENIFDRW